MGKIGFLFYRHIQLPKNRVYLGENLKLPTVGSKESRLRTKVGI